MEKKKPWAGRFRKGLHPLVERFTASIEFDKRLFKEDIKGSIAQARMLEKAGILTKKERVELERALKEIEKEIETGSLQFGTDTEDIHMAIERRLIEKIGPLGGKLHTGRSRNDQIALDLKLYVKRETLEILHLIRKLQRSLYGVAKDNIDVIMPGYTHLQRAQAVPLAHHLLAYYEMLKRDSQRLKDCLKRVDIMPLGSGALAGTGFDVDRAHGAELLGFSAVTENSMDAVSDRDFVVEFISHCAVVMMHLSRLCEEIVLWTSKEFGFVELDDSFATGSSLMPQKKNPDVAELIRGKTGRVYGNLVAILTVMKALPLTYNRDMQEDKEPLFDTVDTVKGSLSVLAPMLETMKINRETIREATCGGFLTATDVADYLVLKGVPFREAHHIAGSIVASCIEKGKELTELTLQEWRSFSPLFEEDIKEAVSVEGSVKRRKARGAASIKEVRRQLKRVERELKKEII